MKKLLLILLFVSTVLNAQTLELLFDNDLPELNPNPDFANWNYAELVTNGTFNSGSSWTLTPNTAISGGTLNYAAPSTETPYQFISLSAGKVYQIKFDLLNYTSGNFRLSFSGASYLTPDYHVSGSYAKVAPYVSSGLLGLASYTGFTGSIDNISVSELVPPTGFTSATMNATNYVIQSSGCKFVEATGTTYIETSSALKKGTRKFKVTQDWTQGRLSISNGTTSVNLNQSDGTQTVSLYFDGTQKMKVECTNNTTSIISYLSIK